MNYLRRWNCWCDSERQKFKYLGDVLSVSRQKHYLASVGSSACCICNELIAEGPVIHHCHCTGKVFGVAHSKCNLQARIKRFLPVFFHNLARYDAHHLIKSLIVLPDEKLTAISRTDEVFISFSLHIKVSEYKCKDGRLVPVYSEIRFLDSFQFMAQSLESLAKTMETSTLSLLREKFSRLSDDEFEKIRGKGLFPYSFLDSSEKFSKPFHAYGPL